MPRSRPRARPIFLGLLACLIASPAVAQAQFLLPPTPREALKLDILFLPENLEALDAPAAAGEARLVVTGAYTGREEPPRPVGFALRDGIATNRYAGGSDGLLLVEADGRASLHDVSAVRYAGARYDLRRDPQAHATFLTLAAERGLSAIQTHLLINEGALDLADIENAPRFRRRLLFETDAGEIGLYDSERPMTLFEAAVALQAAAAPRMALNLDMGSYDFCELARNGSTRSCGVVRRSGLAALTNLIAITAAETRIGAAR